MSVEEIYSVFPMILEQRLSYKRRSVNHPLAPFSHAIVYAIAILLYDQYIRELLDSKIREILEDCDIFFEMSEEQAMDAMSELSNYATIYADSQGEIYQYICNLIKRILVSYPVKYLENDDDDRLA